MEITRDNYTAIIADQKTFEGKSLFIGMPSYGGNMNCLHVQSVISLLVSLAALRIPFTIMMIGSESLISRARNMLSNSFYHEASKFSHLLFLDSDLQFRPEDVLTMLASGKQLVGLPYARKSVDWQRVADSAKAGAPAEVLSTQIGDPVFTLLPNGPRQTTRILEVQDIGCGVMLIARATLEKLASSFGAERKYKLFPQQIEALKHSGFDRDFAFEFFRSGVTEDKIYLSEDYFFCRDHRAIGGKVFTVPWARTIHHGPFGYACDLTIPSFHLKKSEVAPCQ